MYITLCNYYSQINKIVTLIHSGWYKMSYHNSVVLKGWCEFALFSSDRQFVMMYWNVRKDALTKQLKQSDCSMLLHSYLNLHDYFPISKDTVSISLQMYIRPVMYATIPRLSKKRVNER